MNVFSLTSLLFLFEIAINLQPKMSKKKFPFFPPLQGTRWGKDRCSQNMGASPASLSSPAPPKAKRACHPSGMSFVIKPCIIIMDFIDIVTMGAQVVFIFNPLIEDNERSCSAQPTWRINQDRPQLSIAMTFRS